MITLLEKFCFTNEIWVNIFASRELSAKDHFAIRRVCKLFRDLSPVTCNLNLRNYFFNKYRGQDALDSSESAILEAFKPHHAPYFCKLFEPWFIKVARRNIGHATMQSKTIKLLNSPLEVHKQLAYYISTLIKFDVPNHTKFVQRAAAGELKQLCNKLEETLQSPVSYQKLNQILIQLFEEPSFRIFEAFSFRGNYKAYKNLLSHLEELPILIDLNGKEYLVEKFKAFPMVVFSAALAKKLTLEKVRKHPVFQEFLPTSKKIILDLLEYNGGIYQNIQPHLKIDLEIARKAIQSLKTNIKYLPKDLSYDENFAFFIFMNYKLEDALNFINPELFKSSLPFAKLVIEYKYDCLQLFSVNLQKDPSLATAILKGWIKNRTFDAPIPDNVKQALSQVNFSSLPSNDPLLRELVIAFPPFLPFASPQYSDNEELMTSIVQTSATFFPMASQRLRNQANFSLVAIKGGKNSNLREIFEAIGPDLKNDRKFMLTALTILTFKFITFIPFDYASENLKNDFPYIADLLKSGIPFNYICSPSNERMIWGLTQQGLLGQIPRYVPPEVNVDDWINQDAFEPESKKLRTD